MVVWEDLVLLRKYAFPYWKSKRMVNSLIRELYSTSPDYPRKEIELRMVLSYPSRTEKEVAFQALAIGRANQYPDSVSIAAHNRIPGRMVGMIDDVHDDYLRPVLAQDPRISTPADVERLIKDIEYVREFAQTQKPRYDPITKRMLPHPQDLVEAYIKLESSYREWLNGWGEEPISIYHSHKSVLERYQAEDLWCGSKLLAGDFESVRKEYNSIEKIRRLPGKLADMGVAKAMIDNTITGKEDVETKNEALAQAFGPLTEFCQILLDDVSRLSYDLEAKTGNVFTLAALLSYGSLDERILRAYFSENPSIVDEFLKPLVKKIFDGLGKLRELNFMYGDMKLAVNRAMKKGRKNVRKLEKDYGVEFTNEWWDLYQELKWQEIHQELSK